MMPTYIPITLTSDKDNLGNRHHQLNSLVQDAHTKRVTFETIRILPEISPLDSFFKIDLASKQKQLDYIIERLKDEDMLYVSRALKSKWLLDSTYKDIINPRYLEDVLYPAMWTTAQNKFKKWLYLNLKDLERCQEFYQFYCEKNVTYAIRFLINCKPEFIKEEAPKVLEKLTPHYFKMLCEKCPEIATIFFDNMMHNEALKSKFLDNEHKYYNSLKVIFKLDADIFLKITEKYFEKKISPSMTKFIIKHHKIRFDRKPELYTALLLHMKTLAECLSIEECKETVLKLARAKYLSHWFSYKNVEPLIKRLSLAERSSFKKRVFVDKDIGEVIEEWPYETPSLPSRENRGPHVFKDKEHAPYMYECLDKDINMKKRKLKKKSTRGRNFTYLRCEQSLSAAPMKTYLDKLFDEYRFVGFERALFELRKKIGAESSSQNRQYIMLVLVSKTGGRAEFVTALLQLLEQHLNEPAHVRATVIRSFVKRAAIWRLPQETWESILKFAHGLGLDGNPPEADCREGLHAVVLRSLLETGSCKSAIRDAFIKEFSTLVEYSINAAERRVLIEKVPKLLLESANLKIDSTVQAERLALLFDTLQSYKVRIDTSLLIPAVTNLAKRDSKAAEDLLRRLFDAKIARRKLFKANFALNQTDASYLNALRHDINIIDVNKLVTLLEKGDIQAEKFLRKISVYFTEEFGLAHRSLSEIKKRININSDIKPTIARPMCILMGFDLIYIRGLDVSQKHIARIAACVRANIHTGRPKLDMNKIGLSEIGAKAVANKVLRCPANQIDGHIEKLLKWKRTAKLAVVLAQRVGKEADGFAVSAVLSPIATLKAALKYFYHKSESFDPRVWEVIKPLMENINFSKESRQNLRDSISKVDRIPLSIRPEYCVILFKAFEKTYYYKAMSFLCHIEILLPNVNEEFVEKILLEALPNFMPENLSKLQDSVVSCMCLYLRILVKYLLLCKTVEVQKKRIEMICDPLLDNMESLYKTIGRKDRFLVFLDTLLLTLEYKRAFFEVNYVSPLPVMEKIVSWMRRILAVELYFEKYVHVHLTMLYLKSIRQSIKHNPEVLSDEKRKLKEGVDLVGRRFGRYLAREIKELVTTYFDSVIELYRRGLEDYFTKYIEYDVTKSQLIIAILRGILEEGKGAEAKIAVYILKYEYHNINDTVKNDIIKEMNKNENMEMKFCLFANLHM